MDRIEGINKILARRYEAVDDASNKYNEETTHQILDLLPEPLDDKELREAILKLKEIPCVECKYEYACPPKRKMLCPGNTDQILKLVSAYMATKKLVELDEDQILQSRRQ